MLVIIPVRLDSTRFKNKPLTLINGKPLLARVIESALRANPTKIVVAHDGDERLAAIAKQYSVEAVEAVTDANGDEFNCGSERVAYAYHKIGSDDELIINLQGDIPYFPEDTLQQVAKRIEPNGMATLVSPAQSEQLADKNAVKVAVSWDESSEASEGKAVYFSRSAIVASDGKHYFHHGIYGFSPSALRQFASISPSPLEQAESLEQLRALEAGIAIRVGLTLENFGAVDTPEDVANLEQGIKQ